MNDDKAIHDTALLTWYGRIDEAFQLILAAIVLDMMSMRWESELGGPAWLWPTLGLITIVLEVFGYWRVTTLAPESMSLRPSERWRLVTRWLAVFIATFSIVDTAGVVLAWWEWDALMILLMPLVACQFTVFAVYLASLARSIERPRLVWKSHVALWGLAAGLLSFTACLPFMEGEEGRPFPFWLLCTLTASLLAVLVFGISTMVLLWRFRRTFAAATEVSQ